MFKHYRDYFWKMGKPYGKEEVEALTAPLSYKIVSDPYFKRFSIEQYRYQQFEKVVYDSYLLDFRKLTAKDQTAWQRETLKEEKDQMVCLLRNQDDRAVLVETLFFEQNRCRKCVTTSVHGIPLAVHRMFYLALEDHFNGVVLYDNEERTVLHKTYETDPETGEFTNLLSEEWNMHEQIDFHPIK